MAEWKFDIFKALYAVDKRDGDWFAKQPEDARRAFAAPVFMRWASAVKGDGLNHEYMLSSVNELVNVNADVIMTQHPELMFRLAAACGVGKRLEHEWIPNHGRKAGKGNKAYELLAKFYPSANDAEIEMLLSKHTKESFKSFAEESGLPPEEIKLAIKAYGKG